MNSGDRPRRVVFCDFDGTITPEDTFVRMAETFAPAAWERIRHDLFSFRLPLRQAVEQLMEAIPSLHYADILDFVGRYPMRPGFVELLDFLEAQHIPLVVVSGGLRGMVESVVGHLKPRFAALIGGEVDFSRDYLQVTSPYASASELVAKVRVLEQFQPEESVAIGDSITDVNLALRASLVFAKQPLSNYLDERGKSWLPWTDFICVRDELARRWG
jgi:2-hydroxy-3-keto-5-methylthiopentenyl-1-phosphate phosphatase